MMSLAGITVVLVGLLGFSTIANSEPLKVSVYYETLCPDSIRFIVDQYYPVFLKMPEYIKVDLIPYGNAETTTNPDGTYTFKCQHGARECAGNKIHACAIATIPRVDFLMAYINCTISSNDPWQWAKPCAEQLNIKFDAIAECARTEAGDRLLAAYGVRTKNQQPKITWVPWITFNDVFSKSEFDLAEKDLEKAVCSHLPIPKPNMCLNYIHGRSMWETWVG